MFRSRSSVAFALTLTVAALSGRGFSGEPEKGFGPVPENAAGPLPRFALSPAGLFRDGADSASPKRAGLAFDAARFNSAASYAAPSGAAPSDAALSDASAGPASFPSGTLSLFPSLLAQGADDRRASYIQLRAGPLFFIDDFEDLDIGLDAEVAYGFHPIPFLIIEVYSGYLWGEENNSVDSRLRVIPLVANLKLALPLIVRPYVGVGAGGFYINTELDGGAFDDEEDDLVLGWNAMVGINFTIGPVILSAEAKYVGTDSAEVAGGGRAQLEGLAVLVGAGFRF